MLQSVAALLSFCAASLLHEFSVPCGMLRGSPLSVGDVRLLRSGTAQRLDNTISIGCSHRASPYSRQLKMVMACGSSFYLVGEVA